MQTEVQPVERLRPGGAQLPIAPYLKVALRAIPQRLGGHVTSDEAGERFTELVMPHLDDAFRLARWLTGSPHDAEDVVQEAFLRAFSGIGGFSHGNARAWILTIVRRTCYTWLAKNRPKALVFSDDLEAVEREHSDVMALDARAGETPETMLLATESVGQLAALIAKLPVPFREPLVLREVNGLTYREIAEVMEVPIGTVMSRLARARNLLLASQPRESS